MHVVEADATALPPELKNFDRALVDAPCSGLGVLAARPDLRWRSRPLPDLQLALLQEAAARAKPGGTVVYSVCTINADENEAVVEASGLEVEPLGEEWPQFAHPKRPEFLLTRPDLHGTSGFFIARLKGYRKICRCPGASGSAGGVEPRSTRRTSATSRSRSTCCCNAGARIFHFDCGDGHFVEPITMGPIVLAVDLGADPRRRTGRSTAT